MKVNHLATTPFTVVEIISDEVLIKGVQDALDLMGNEPADRYVLYTHNFENDFFDLSTQKLGEVLQKFTNYRVMLAIVGDFDTYPSKVLKQFIYESNRAGQYLFMASLDAVKDRWKING